MRASEHTAERLISANATEKRRHARRGQRRRVTLCTNGCLLLRGRASTYQHKLVALRRKQLCPPPRFAGEPNLLCDHWGSGRQGTEPCCARAQSSELDASFFKHMQWEVEQQARGGGRVAPTCVAAASHRRRVPASARTEHTSTYTRSGDRRRSPTLFALRTRTRAHPHARLRDELGGT
eukprot:6193689-Pleurochrysis_carterae.AAC.1